MLRTRAADDRTRTHETSKPPSPIGWQHTDRFIGWLIAIGGAVLFVGKAVPELADADDYALWWNALGTVHAALILGLAVGGKVLPFPVLRAVWILVPALSVILQATAFAAYDGASPHTVTPWPWTLGAVGTSLIALVVRPWVAVVFVIATAFLPALSGLLFLGFVPDTVAALTPIHITDIGFVAIFLGIRGQLNRSRESHEAAIALREEQARAEAKAARQEHLSRLIHDQVLSVLTSALALSGSPPYELQQAAVRALTLGEDSSLAPLAPAETLDAHQAITSIAKSLHGLDPAMRIVCATATGALPMKVTAALTDAAAEAMRNSIRHAGTDAVREARISAEDGGAVVVITDTGIGFDPEAIPPERMGIRGSILARMQRAGGVAVIRSSPGAGTEVTLSWPA